MVPDFDWLGINESQKDNQGWLVRLCFINVFVK
jgi:hypothetical protein